MLPTTFYGNQKQPLTKGTPKKIDSGHKSGGFNIDTVGLLFFFFLGGMVAPQTFFERRTFKV